ncbi:MAG: DUF6279 family lipoprotein [Betaproteobacteria bacterium]
MNLSIGSKRLSALKIIVAGLLLSLLGACSAVKVAYNNGHELAWWWLSDYLDVNGEDRSTLRQAVHQLHDWHRREQLPTYVDMLRGWQGPVGGDLNSEQVCRMADELLQRAAALAAMVQVLDPPALQVLARLNPGQLAEMERNFAKGNRKFRDKYINVSPKELLVTRLDNALSRAEWLYGPLGRVQEQALRAALQATPWDAREALDWRVRRQQDIAQTLRGLSQGQATPEQARIALGALLSRQLDPQEPAERARVMATRQQSCQVLAQLHASTTPAQRAKAQETLRNYAADLATLVAPR